MSTDIGLILSRSSGGAMPPFGSAGKCLREEPGGMGRNELSANAIAASTHRPHRCSENVFTYRTKRQRVTGATISPVTTSSLGAWRPSPQAARCDCRARRYGARCLGNGGTARCTSASRNRTPAADGDVLRSGRLDGARRAPRSGSSRSVERMAQCCRGSVIIDPGPNSLCLPRVNLTMPRERAA
jgi:hypothetical protein